MKFDRAILVSAFVLVGVFSAAAHARQLTDADYARAAKFLLDSTDPLVGHFDDPKVDHEVQQVKWLDATHFWYRDHRAAGDRILEMDAVTGAARSAFNALKLAAALGRARGKSMKPNRWPAFGFDFHRLKDGALHVELGKKKFRCNLAGAGVCVLRERESSKHKGKVHHVHHAKSPDGEFRVFMRNWNLWARNTSTGKTVQLTTNGVENYGYGTKDDGGGVVRWSPDSKRLVAFRIDQRKVKNMYTVVTRVGHPTLKTWPYPLPGDKYVFMVHPMVINVATHREIPLKMAPEQRLGSWGVVKWSPDGKTFALISTSRNQQHEWFRVANAATGYVRTVFEYAARDFYQGWYGRPDWQYLPKKGVAIWPAEQTNWMNLYLYSLRTGRMLRPITTGTGDVIQVKYVDRKTDTGG